MAAQQENKQVRQYEYSRIKDLKAGSTVNLYGIVKFFKPSHKTRGTDYSMVISVIDQSVKDDDKLKCVLFAREDRLLPRVARVGDIVRLHRLRVRHYNGALQGQSGPGFSCLAFAGDPDADFTAHSTSAHFTLTDADKEKVAELRRWGDTSVTLSQADVTRRTQLADVTCGEFFDLVCVVLAVCELSDDAFLFKVWDGTQFQMPVHHENLDEAAAKEKYTEDKLLMRKAAGFIHEVKVYDNHTAIASTIKPGDVVKLCNLHSVKCKAGSQDTLVPTVEFLLHGGTSYGKKVCVLSPDDSDAIELRRSLDEKEPPGNDVTEESDSECSVIEIPAIDTSISDDLAQSKRRAISKQLQNDKPSTSKQGLNNNADDVNINFTQSKSATKRKYSDGINLDDSSIYDIDLSPVKKRKGPENGLDVVPSVDSAATATSDRVCMQVNASVITAHHHIAQTCLCDVHLGTVPNKYRVRVQVKDFQPQPECVEQFLRLYCDQCHFVAPLSWREGREAVSRQGGVHRYHCPRCQEKSPEQGHTLEYIYMMRLLLQDSTAWAVAQLWRQHAVTFFNDIQPETLLKNKRHFEEIKSWLEVISSENASSSSVPDSSPPWLECCLQAYTTQGGTCLQVFDTSLCPDILQTPSF